MLALHFYFLARDRFASFYQEGGVSALNNGWFIMQLPETLIGTAIAIALLPSLSELVTHGDQTGFRQTINRALRAMLALSLPAAAVMAVTIRPLVDIVFNFGPARPRWWSGRRAPFCSGLPGHSWLEVGVRSWYAKQNALIPLLGSVIQLGLFIPLALSLSRSIGHTGLALAETLAFTSQAVLLLFLVNRQHPGVLRVGNTLFRSLIAALLGAGLALAILQLPLPAIQAAGLALLAGGLVSIPLIIPELRLMIRL